MTNTLRILCYGHDEMLLFTRKCILEQSYAVETATTLTALLPLLDRGPVAVAVICHSVPDAECEQVINLVRAQTPDVKVLVVVESSHSDCADHSDSAMQGLAGPNTLLRQVQALVEEAQA